MFKRLNAGKPLSTKSKVLASCKDIESMIDIGQHELFSEMLTEKARNNKNQVSIIVKSWCMLNKRIDDISFEGKVLNQLTENLIISTDERTELEEVFNLVVDTHTTLLFHKHNKVARKLYTETLMIAKKWQSGYLVSLTMKMVQVQALSITLPQVLVLQNLLLFR